MSYNHREDAEVLRFGVQVGALEARAIIDWADDILQHEPDAEGPFFELAVGGGDVQRLVALLGDVPGIASRTTVDRRYLGLLSAMLERDATKGATVARIIYELASSGHLPREEFGDEPFFLDEYFTEPFYTPSEATRNLREYLQSHAVSPVATKTERKPAP